MIFFSLTFIIIFVIFTFFRFLSSWFDSVRVINLSPEQGDVLLAAARASLPITVFLTVLLSLSYSARKQIKAIFSILIVFVFSGVFCFFFHIGIERISAWDPSLEISGITGHKSGLILTRLNTDIIYLADNAAAPRVISFPDRPLLYQETPVGPESIAVTLPLEEKTPWFIQSVLIDFGIIAREFDSRQNEGLLSFISYTLAPFLLLVSMRFLFDSTSWPMANLFLGALVFRFILGFAVFLRSGEVHAFLLSFVNNRIPGFLVIPAVFAIPGILVMIYAVLAFLAGRLRRYDE